MPIIQITNTYKDEVLDVVKSYVPEGFTIRILSENSEEALLTCVSDADYILASGRVPISDRVIRKAEHLKMVQRTGVGLDQIDQKALRQAGIPLYVNQGVNARSVAEHTILLILASLRKLTMIDRNSKNGIWKKQAQGITTYELAGKKVGIIGMGNIGRIVADMLSVFGAELYYYDAVRLDGETEQQKRITYLSCEEIFATADIITLHCPLVEATKELICEASLKSMKDGVIIINTSRGGLINEPHLLSALQTGKVAFAGLDVHRKEPFDKDDELVLHEHVIATPHIAGITYDSFSSMMRNAMRNIKCYEDGDLVSIKDNLITIE